MTAGQQADFRRAIGESQAIGDDRGYQRWASRRHCRTECRA
jgi:hypothetical protein